MPAWRGCTTPHPHPFPTKKKSVTHQILAAVLTGFNITYRRQRRRSLEKSTFRVLWREQPRHYKTGRGQKQAVSLWLRQKTALTSSRRSPAGSTWTAFLWYRWSSSRCASSELVSESKQEPEAGWVQTLESVCHLRGRCRTCLPLCPPSSSPPWRKSPFAGSPWRCVAGGEKGGRGGEVSAGSLIQLLVQFDSLQK